MHIPDLPRWRWQDITDPANAARIFCERWATSPRFVRPDGRWPARRAAT